MLNKGDLVKIETLGEEPRYGAIVFLGEEGKHVSICLHEEGDIKAQFDEHRVIEQPNDSLAQPSPHVTEPSTCSGDTVDI